MKIELSIGEKGPNTTYVFDADSQLGIALKNIGFITMSWEDGENLMYQIAQEYSKNPYAKKTKPFHIEFDK